MTGNLATISGDRTFIFKISGAVIREPETIQRSALPARFRRRLDAPRGERRAALDHQVKVITFARMAVKEDNEATCCCREMHRPPAPEVS